MKRYSNTMIVKILGTLLGVIILGFVLTRVINIAYALINQDSPNVIITINSNGQVGSSGSLFGDDLWYPGKEISGIIRINNNYRPIKVSNLGLSVDITKAGQRLDDQVVYNSFVDNMNITINQGKLLVFSNTLVDRKSFSELLYKPGDAGHSGYDLQGSNQFTIMKDDTVDLQYTLLMGEKSGNELEDLSAEVSFLINMGDNLN